MKICDCVKTKERAKGIIVEFIVGMKLNLLDGVFKDSSRLCKCGKTHAITWDGPDSVSLSVPACEACGNDDASMKDVLIIH